MDAPASSSSDAEAADRISRAERQGEDEGESSDIALVAADGAGSSVAPPRLTAKLDNEALLREVMRSVRDACVGNNPAWKCKEAAEALQAALQDCGVACSTVYGSFRRAPAIAVPHVWLRMAGDGSVADITADQFCMPQDTQPVPPALWWPADPARYDATPRESWDAIVNRPDSGGGYAVDSEGRAARVASFTFGEGKLGLVLDDEDGGPSAQVVVTEVRVYGLGAAQGVLTGSVLVGLNAQSVVGMSRDDVIDLIQATTRPLSLQFVMAAEVPEEGGAEASPVSPRAVPAVARCGGSDSATLKMAASKALKAAAQAGDLVEVRRILEHAECDLEHGAGSYSSGVGEGTVLSWAAGAVARSDGNAEVLGALLQAGADINATDCEDQTALMCAAKSGAVRDVEALLAHGTCDLEKRDKYDRSALDFAAVESGELAVVEALVKGGARPGAADARGQTALMKFACSVTMSPGLYAGIDQPDVCARWVDALSDGESSTILSRDRSGKAALNHAQLSTPPERLPAAVVRALIPVDGGCAAREIVQRALEEHTQWMAAFVANVAADGSVVHTTWQTLLQEASATRAAIGSRMGETK